jgi:hypothetical protein
MGSSAGGSSIFGGGARGATNPSSGNNGSAYGGGASGAVREMAPGVIPGATGAAGVVIIEEFY